MDNTWLVTDWIKFNKIPTPEERKEMSKELHKKLENIEMKIDNIPQYSKEKQELIDQKQLIKRQLYFLR